jgi:hypothetical protein
MAEQTNTAASPKAICINCVTGHLLPGEPKGKEEKIGNVVTYVAMPSSGAVDKSKAIISFTDVFEIGLKNIKIVGDMLAEQTGLAVYIPDVSLIVSMRVVGDKFGFCIFAFLLLASSLPLSLLALQR